MPELYRLQVLDEGRQREEREQENEKSKRESNDASGDDGTQIDQPDLKICHNWC